MSKGLFITATGTDVGKTYVAALIVKKLHVAGLRAGYYKPVASGAPAISLSDAGVVKAQSGIGQDESSMLGYLYREAAAPHLAARLEGPPVELASVLTGYRRLQDQYDYVTVEGSGGIVCPLRWDESVRILQEDLIRQLRLNTVIVADAGLGTINATVVTAHYLRSRGIGIKGVIVNRFGGGVLQEDNLRMIQLLTDLPLLAVVKPGAHELSVDVATLAAWYD